MTRAPQATRELPTVCPACGVSLSDHPYYQLVPPPAARALQRVAVALLGVMALLYLGLVAFGRSPLGFGTGHGYLAVAFITAPSLLLVAISRMFRRRRRVVCLRCSWNEEYPRRRSAHTPERQAA